VHTLRLSARPGVWLLVALGLAPGFLPAAGAGQPGVKADVVAHKGWKKNARLSNGDAELIVTLDVGPRIISYRLANGKNVLKEYEDQLGKSGEPTWQIRGGHRLWIGPEDLTRTYAPDNRPVQNYSFTNGVARFTQAPDAEYGVQKEIDVQLSPSGSHVTVIHRVANVGDKPTELAVWASSVMAPGGVEIIPLPPKMPHPGSPKNAKSPEDFGPNQTVALWPYFDFGDPRWTFGSRYLQLRQAKRGPTKLGLAHGLGWIGYLNGGTLFVKRIAYEKGKTYPDNGVNFETFTNEDMLEIESLGPLVRLAPGQKAEMTERWELVGGLPSVSTEGQIDEVILPRVRDR
jgi:hypothetical protein